MPDMGGNEVAAHMQEDPNLKHIPIIFLTAVIKPRGGAQRPQDWRPLLFIQSL